MATNRRVINRPASLVTAEAAKLFVRGEALLASEGDDNREFRQVKAALEDLLKVEPWAVSVFTCRPSGL
jgi:hypothetical protein